MGNAAEMTSAPVVQGPPVVFAAVVGPATEAAIPALGSSPSAAHRLRFCPHMDGGGHHFIQHRLGEFPGESVLLAGMITAQELDRSALFVGELGWSALSF